MFKNTLLVFKYVMNPRQYSGEWTLACFCFLEYNKGHYVTTGCTMCGPSLCPNKTHMDWLCQPKSENLYCQKGENSPPTPGSICQNMKLGQ